MVGLSLTLVRDVPVLVVGRLLCLEGGGRRAAQSLYAVCRCQGELDQEAEPLRATGCQGLVSAVRTLVGSPTTSMPPVLPKSAGLYSFVAGAVVSQVPSTTLSSTSSQMVRSN